MNTEFQIPETNEVFADLLNEQMGDNSFIGKVVKGTIVKVTPDFVTVDVGLKSEGNIPVREFGNNAELKAGDVVEAKITSVDKKNVKIGLSIKALEVEEEKKVLEEYSNTASGSSLGEALGEALKKAN